MLGKNIIELQKELSYMPMDRLVSLVDDPNSIYGSLPLIEIQNRKQLQEGSKPSERITTVADDIISSVASPTSMDTSSPTSLNPASGGIAQLPMRQMAEGGSVYSNPYFGNADPEEVRKLQERMPGLSTEDAVAMVLGIDTADITTGYDNGGLATLKGEATLSPLEQSREMYGYQSDEEFDKQKRMLMLMQLGANIAKAEDFSDIIEGNQDIFTTRMALEEKRREDDMGLATLSSKLDEFDTSDVSNIATALEKARADGHDQDQIGTKTRDSYETLLKYYEYLLSQAPQEKGIGSLNTVKADLSPIVAPAGV